MLNEVPPVGYPGMPRHRRLTEYLRAVDFRARRTRIALAALLTLVLWYALTSLMFRDGIRAAVFAREIPDSSDRVSICYLEIEGARDPSGRLLARFRGGLVPVEKRSAMPPTVGTEHVVPGLPNSIYYGYILSVDKIRLVLPFLAVVEASGYQAGLAGGGCRHIVLGLGPAWRVVSTKGTWIS